MNVHAEYNDGRSAVTHPVVCAFLGEMLELRSGGGEKLAVWRLSDILAENPERLPLRLRHTGNAGERLVVREDAAASLFKERLAPVLTERRSRNRRRWVAGTVAVWLGVLLLWVVSPFAVDLVTDLVPRSWEQGMGEEARNAVGRILSGTYSGDVPWRDSGPGYEALRDIVTRLAAVDDTAGYTFQVSILKAELVNAFALPGGYIVVTTGLIGQCRTPDELAGVVAHEMAHVTKRHNTRQLVRDQFFSFAAKVLMGGSDLMELVRKAGNTIVSSSFSREDEREADLLGVRRLARAGINPEGIARFFAGLPKSESRSGKFTYLDSHPLLADRQEYMRREAANFPGPFTPALDETRWRSLKTMAGAR